MFGLHLPRLRLLADEADMFQLAKDLFLRGVKIDVKAA
jgi:hypothetical protein